MFSGVVPVAISCAIDSPDTGPALNPYVPHPISTRKPSTGVMPMIGLKSGVMSHKPAHCRKSRILAIPGISSST